MRLRIWLRCFRVGVVAATLAACVSTPPAEPTEAGALASDEKALYSCLLPVGAPHKRIDVLEVTMTPEELASAKAAEQEAAAESPAETDDATTLEKSVRISVYELEDGAEGHCFRRLDSGRYQCQTYDGNLHLEWPAGSARDPEPAGPASVQIKEKWLFGTKEYSADCSRKG